MLGSRREPALKNGDDSSMVLGRRGTFLGEETEDTAQLLNCRGKKVTNGGRKSIFISAYKEIIT